MKFETDVNLQHHHTFAVNANAAHLVTVHSAQDCETLLQHPLWQQGPHFILGGGSNTLFVDDFPGLIVKVAIPGIALIKETAAEVWLQVGAGVNWHSLVLYCLEHHYGGIENLALIPGTVGAAPIQNIGAYGCELKQVFESLRALNTETGHWHTFTNEECQFGYRDSVFKQALANKTIITEVCLRLQKRPQFNISYPALANYFSTTRQPLSLQTISEAVMTIRRQKLPDPTVLPNAGSFFKNPIISHSQWQTLQVSHPTMPHFPSENSLEVKIPAGWLIEHCGWKGKRVGGTGTHEQQALVIINHSNARGQDIVDLAQRIMNDVKTRFDITLTPEVGIVTTR